MLDSSPARPVRTVLVCRWTSCAGKDLLGESWDDPAARWSDLATKIDTWTSVYNPFPELTSHAQRTIGWAQLTLMSDDLAYIHEYSGHAQLHVDAMRDAIAECD